MTTFGPSPLDPRGVQGSLAGAQGVRAQDRTRPTTDASQRMRDARDRRVAGAEGESAVRRTADEHADEDSESHRDRRDGQRDEFRHETTHAEASDQPEQQPLPAASQRPPTPASRDGLPHIDVRG